MFADSSDAPVSYYRLQEAQAHARECFDFIVYKAEHYTACVEDKDRNREFDIKF